MAFVLVGRALGLPFWANLLFAVGVIVATVPEVRKWVFRRPRMPPPPATRPGGGPVPAPRLRGEAVLAFAFDVASADFTMA